MKLIFGSFDKFVYKYKNLLTLNLAFNHFDAIKLCKEVNNPINMYFNNKTGKFLI